MARRRVEKKRVSMYQFKQLDDESIDVRKWAVVRGESFEPESAYQLTKLHADVPYACNCPARVLCRHVKMVTYCKAMGWPSPDTYVYWQQDDKEPEHMSIDDIVDRWDVPDPRKDQGDSNFDD